MKFHVPDMSCGHCTAAITKVLKALDDGAEVRTDLETRTVEVTTSASAAEVAGAMKAAGYDSTPA